MDAVPQALDDATIVAFVQRFYEIARADPELAPVFDSAIKNWDAHFKVFGDFWSTALLGSGRYQGTGYTAHMNLPVEEYHFDHWLQALETAARETLPPEAAERAMARARHMAMSYKSGLLPFRRADGTWSRTPGG